MKFASVIEEISETGKTIESRPLPQEKQKDKAVISLRVKNDNEKKERIIKCR